MQFNEEILSGDYVHDDLIYQEPGAKFGLPGTTRSGKNAPLCPCDSRVPENRG